MSAFDDPARADREWVADIQHRNQLIAALVRLARGESVAAGALAFTHRPRERMHLDRKHPSRRRPRR